jgi:hypothetical protein
MKIRPVGTELFHTDGQTGMTKIIVALCSFAKAPNKVCWLEVAGTDSGSCPVWGDVSSVLSLSSVASEVICPFYRLHADVFM